MVIRGSKLVYCLLATAVALSYTAGAAADDASKPTLDKQESETDSQLNDPVALDPQDIVSTSTIEAGTIISSSTQLPGSIPCVCTLLASRIKDPLPSGAQVQNPSTPTTSARGDDTAYKLDDGSGCSGSGPYCTAIGCTGTLTYKNGTQTVSDTYQGTCRALKF